jgi:hypothetical protein
MKIQKITFVILIVSVLLLALSYFVYRNIGSFCYPGNFDCVLRLKFGVSLSLAHLLPYVIANLIFILILKEKYKKFFFIFSVFLNIAIFLLVFNLPYSCGGFLCFDKPDGAMFFRNLYPIVLVPTFIILVIYFYIKDRRSKNIKNKPAVNVENIQ